jgi:hypothetical protein
MQTMTSFYSAIRNQWPSFGPRMVRLSIALAWVVVITWLVLDIFGPKPADQGYEVHSLEALWSLYAGHGGHTATEFLSVFGIYLRTVLFTLLYLAGAIYILIESLRPKSASRATKRKSIAILAIFFMLIVLRDPSVFSEPRFWAEEATVYFHAAYAAPFWQALIAPHQGYFSLWANLAAVSATLPPLEYAPVVTTIMALLVQLMIFAAILANESDFLNSPTRKAVACMAALVVGATGEIWLTTINSQHYLPLLVFLILVDSKKNPVKRRFWYFIAGLSGLSSIASNFLAPLFLLRYWQRRDKSDLIIFLIFAVTALIQISSIIYSFFINIDPANAYRFHSKVDFLNTLKSIYFFAFVYPQFGWSWSRLGIALLPFVLIYSARQWRSWLVFVMAILLLTTLSVISSMGMLGGPRYAYSSAVILALMLLSIAVNVNVPPMARLMSGALLFLSVSYWTMHFMFQLDTFRDSRWPVWSSEVAAWRLDPCRELRVHPLWPDKSGKMPWFIQLPASTGQTLTCAKSN